MANKIAKMLTAQNIVRKENCGDIDRAGGSIAVGRLMPDIIEPGSQKNQQRRIQVVA
jgi:hypothetical protein